eukprot:scaffold172224_cov61-Attheya_sp.AAC.4
MDAVVESLFVGMHVNFPVGDEVEGYWKMWVSFFAHTRTHAGCPDSTLLKTFLRVVVPSRVLVQ